MAIASHRTITSNTAIIIGTTSGVIGVVVGIFVPSLFRRLNTTKLTRWWWWSSSSSSSVEDGSSKDGTHSVRESLSDSSVSIRINQLKLNLFLSNILIKAAAAAADNNDNKGAKCSTTTAAAKRQEKVDLVSSVLTYADARGIPSHGSNRCDAYANEIVLGLVDVEADPIVEKETGCCAVVNGNNGLGAVTSQLAMKKAIELANKYGVSVVTCHSSNHYGAAGYWAKIALDRNMIGMSFTNTSPFAVPTGGTTRAVGTNPFCFFAPATTSTENNNDIDYNDSYQLDMATTAVPIGKVEVMDRIGRKVPSGWGVDENGRDCTDPAIICKRGGLYPLGGSELTAGYKGYGLGMFVEIICSVLSSGTTTFANNNNIGPDIQSWNTSRDGPLNYGHCFIVIDPKRFGNNDDNSFERRLGDYLSRMRGLPGNVIVAGDPEKEFEIDAANNGIVLHKSVAITLKALAVRFDVQPVPSELQQLDENKSRASLYEQ